VISIAVTGWSTINSAGIGRDALTGRLAGVTLSGAPVDPGGDVAGLYEEPLPSPNGHALTGFDRRALLGRKGTGSYDRATALAVVCCQEALREAATTVDDTTRARIGVALGTSLGSFKSTSDFSRETLIQERPYLVNPLLFPNTVMNCAAGQVAIRFGLRAANATIAGGTLAFLNAVRYAGNAIERGYADVMLTGAVEEYSPHRAWASHLTGATATVSAGEAAAVFVLAGPQAPAWAGPRRCARILAVATGYGPGDQTGDALVGCVERALARAGARADQVRAVLSGEADDTDNSEYGPVVRALGHEPERIMTKRLFGECDAASTAVSLAALLAAGPIPGAGEGLSLLTARGADGAGGAAIVEGPADAGSDRG
jgi:3-oxoacyl-[acyl-carrier-protein] synthase II